MLKTKTLISKFVDINFNDFKNFLIILYYILNICLKLYNVFNKQYIKLKFVIKILIVVKEWAICYNDCSKKSCFVNYEENQVIYTLLGDLLARLLYRLFEPWVVELHVEGFWVLLLDSVFNNLLIKKLKRRRSRRLFYNISFLYQISVIFIVILHKRDRRRI